MIVEVGKKYVNIKSNEVVKVRKLATGIYESTVDSNLKTVIPIVAYIDPKDIYHVSTVWDFTENFNPVEPIFEYQYAYYTEVPYGCYGLTGWSTEEEILELEGKYIRLDFTKRERG